MSYYQISKDLARCIALNKYYEKGQYERYFKELEKIAQETSLPFALTQVGYCLLEGIGTKTDPKAAFKYLEKAAKAGEWDGQYNLASMYEEGLGTKKDLSKAIYWYKKAQDQGHTYAKERLEELSKDKTLFIETERLVLHPLFDEDKIRLIDIFKDERVYKTCMLPDFKDDDMEDAFFKKLKDLSYDKDHYVYGIYLDDKIIGLINDVINKDDMIELGYLIDPKHHNNGYMTESLKAVIEDLVKRGYKVIECAHFKDNIASARVMQKAGMKKIEKVEEITYRGQIHECIYYAYEVI